MNLEELKAKKDKYINGIFWLCLQIALIFGIPAFLGAYFGKILDARYDTGKKITFGILIFTFIISWVMVVYKYKQLSKKIKDIDDQIKKLKDADL